LQNYFRCKLREKFNECIKNVNAASNLKDKKTQDNDVFDYENVKLKELYQQFIIPLSEECDKLKLSFNRIKNEILAGESINDLDEELYFSKININKRCSYDSFIIHCNIILFTSARTANLNNKETLSAIAEYLRKTDSAKIKNIINYKFNHTKINKSLIQNKVNNLVTIKKSFTFNILNDIKLYLDFEKNTITNANFVLFNDEFVQQGGGGASISNCSELNTRNVNITYINNITNIIKFMSDDDKLNKNLLNINFDFWGTYSNTLNVESYKDYIHNCVNIYKNADVFIAKLIKTNNDNISLSPLELDLTQFKFSNRVKYYLKDIVNQGIQTQETWINMLTGEEKTSILTELASDYKHVSPAIIDSRYFNQKDHYALPNFTESLQSLTIDNLKNLKFNIITNDLLRFKLFKTENKDQFNIFFNQDEKDKMNNFKQFADAIQTKNDFILAQNKLINEKSTTLDFITKSSSIVKPFVNMLTIISKADYTKQIENENHYEKFRYILDKSESNSTLEELKTKLTTKINNAIDLIRQTRCKLEIAYEVCENRRKEGLFINNSLAGVRSIILESIDAGANIPDYSSFCSKMYCDFTNNTKCFSGSKSGNMDKKVQDSSKIIFETLAREFNSTVDKFKQDMQICIFCVFNMSKGQFAPYIDVNYFKHLINSV
jgi:hypothetical protein